MNTRILRDIADKDNRNYITPEDITAAYESGASYEELSEELSEEFMSILGRCSKDHLYGIEDKSLTAFCIIDKRLVK